jgi:hypothetical protein
MRRIICIMLTVLFSLNILPVSLFAANYMSDVVIDETIIEPKDPILATVIAIGPGLLAHGFGNFYAEDYRMGLLLFGTEVVSLGIIGVGYVIYKGPSNFTSIGGNIDEAQRGGLVTLLCGIGLFALSWVADIVTAGRAAEQFNTENHLEFKMNQQSYAPSVMYTYNF